MTDTETVESKTDKSSAKDETPNKATSPLEIKLIENAHVAMELPLPEKDDYWTISSTTQKSKKKSRLLSFLKKQELTDDDLNQLRTEVERAPGRAKVKIKELLKGNTGNTDLMMLYALCSYRMVMNSSNRKGALKGLKTATKDSANALLDDGISLYNCERFFDIYFEYLNRLKRFQVSTYKSLGETVRQQELKKKLETFIKMCDNLIDEKKRAVKVLHRIKGRFKSSNYSDPWEFSHIKLAGKKVEQAEFRHMCGPAESQQLIIYIMAMLDIFARIPILSSLVDTILQLIPEGTLELLQRKASIQGRRAFTQLGLLIKEGDKDRVRTLGRHIYKTSFENLKQISTHHVKQAFEADPYFNLCRSTLMTFGLYKAEEQNEMLQSSIKSIKRLIKLDESKNQSFTQLAAKMELKLSSFMV